MKTKQPPSWPSVILRRLCSPEQLEILYGDVYEVFHQRARKGGRLKAKLLFYRDAFSLIRPFALKRADEYHSSLGYLSMMSIHLKTSLRSLFKNRMSTGINIFGLTIGMTAVLLIAQFAIFELNFDRFHENSESIHRVSFARMIDNQRVFNSATVFMPVGPELVEAFPEVEDQVRFYYGFTHGEVKVGDQTFNEEKAVFTEPSYFNVFSYGLKIGNPKTALSEPNKVIISESLATKYFGHNEAIGQVIHFSFEDGETDLEVSGIFEDPRSDSHLRLHFLMSFKTLDQWSVFKEGEWNLPFYHTYLQFNDNFQKSDFEVRASELIREFRGGATEQNIVEELELQPLKKIHLDSDLTFELFENGDRQSVNFMIGIAILILLIAYLNYINLATAKAVKRAKEVGVRKILGSKRRQLVDQFLTEAFLLSFVALGLAIILVIVILPYFSEMVQKPFSIAKDPVFWVSVVVAAGVGGLVSGIYPAFVLSSYKPISILKGSFSTSSRGSVLRKVLVSFQFLISISMIGGTMLLLNQTNFLMNKDLGFEADQIMVVNAPRTAQNADTYLTRVRAFAGEVQSLSGINRFTHSGSVPGKVMAPATFQNKANISGEPSSLQLITLDYGFFKTFGLEFLKGRAFSKDHPTDQATLIINESALKALGFENAEDAIKGKIVSIGSGREFDVLGVVRNHHHTSLKSSYEPIVFALFPNQTLYFSFNVNTSNLVGTVERLESMMSRHFPDSPFEYSFLNQAFDAEFKAELRFVRVFRAFSILSILLGSLGLFGLAAFMASQKLKEISIRKVLGARLMDILSLLASSFTMSLLVGSVLACLALYFGGRAWLENYAFRIEMSWRHFVLPIAVVILLSVLTIAYQTIKVATTEPTKNLRNE